MSDELRRPRAAICGTRYKTGALFSMLYRCTRPKGHDGPCWDETREPPEQDRRKEA